MPKVNIQQLRQLHHERCRQNWHIAADLARHDYELDLSNMDLSSITDWRNVDFTGMDLRASSFIGCKLAGANFTGARITGADFSNANIIGLTKIAAPQLETITIDHSALPPILRRKVATA